MSPLSNTLLIHSQANFQGMLQTVEFNVLRGISSIDNRTVDDC